MNSKEGAPYSEKMASDDISHLLIMAANQGFPFAEAHLNEVAVRRLGDKALVDLSIRIREGRRTFCSGVRLIGNSYTKDYVILREINLPKGSLYLKNKIDAIPARLNRLGFLKQAHPPQLIAAAADSVDIVVRVEEGNASAFDGVIGYIPDRSKSGGYFSGLIDLSFKNLFGTGRLFDIHWKKADRFSEEFYLAYTEPWISGYPVDVGITLERVVRDTTYLEWNFSLNARLRLLDRISLFGGFKRHSVLPDSMASRELRLARNTVINGEIGLEYDTRDYPANPSSGVLYMSSYTFGLKTNQGPAYLFIEDSLKRSESLNSLRLKLEWYQRLWANQVLAVQLSARQIKGGRLQLTDYFWFGGSRSLRGYRENQFRGSDVAWLNLEYRFLLGRSSRAFLFNDWGFYRQSIPEKQQKTLTGYGFGVRFETALGVFGIDYGLGKGDSFRDGKIHFGVVNRF
jgi:outer membrane protein insertion porin family